MKLEESASFMRLLKKYLPLICALAGITFVFLFFAFQKSGMFIDEIHTYALSNSYYQPFVKNIKDGDMIDKVYTRQELINFTQINGDEGFDFGSVYYNQTMDVHPPLYYWIVNIISSIFRDGFSKWPMLIVNLIIFLGTLILLYKITDRLLKSKKIALISVLLYGLSSIGMSTVLMIRMYILLTFLTVLLVYLSILYIEKGRLVYAVPIMITIYAGLMTQYYFVFYAFFMCISVIIYLIVKKKYKQTVVFGISAIIGVALMVVSFPAVINHLFADKLVSGGNALENLKNISQYAERIIQYADGTARRSLAIIVIGIASFLVLIFKCKKIRGFKDAISIKPLLFIIPIVLTVTIIAIISPVYTTRYIYNVMPMVVFTVCYIIYVLVSISIKHHLILDTMLVLAIIFSFIGLNYPPEYLCKEQREYNKICKAYSENPCVYINDNYNTAITRDLLQLIYFDDFFVTNNTSSDKLHEYIETHKNNNELVVYVDIDEFWASGYDSKEIMDEMIRYTDSKKYTLLYKTNSSEIYLMTKAD